MDQEAIAKAVAHKGCLANIDIDQVLDRIASGEIMRSIAIEYGVAKQSLRERLLKHPRYVETIKEQAESIVEDATAECMGCEADMPVIARARLRLEAAHKWAAARDPGQWGNKQQVTVLTLDLGDRIRRARERVIEPEPATIEDVQVQQVTEVAITERSLTNQVLESKG